MSATTIAVGVVLIGGGLLLAHEATHLLAARLAGPVDVAVRSWVPPRLELHWHAPETIPPAIQGAVVLAPTLVGVGAASIAFALEWWAVVFDATPFPPETDLLLWLCYAHASPADLRSAYRIAHGQDATAEPAPRRNS